MSVVYKMCLKARSSVEAFSLQCNNSIREQKFLLIRDSALNPRLKHLANSLSLLDSLNW